MQNLLRSRVTARETDPARSSAFRRTAQLACVGVALALLGASGSAGLATSTAQASSVRMEATPVESAPEPAPGETVIPADEADATSAPAQDATGAPFTQAAAAALDWSSLAGATSTVPGVYVAAEMKMDLYAAAGEQVAVALSLPDGVDRASGVVTLRDPSGAVVAQQDLVRGDLVGSWSSRTSGVWVLEMPPGSEVPGTGVTDTVPVEWHVGVLPADGSRLIPGRIWSDSWGLSQLDRDNRDLAFYALIDSGAQYRVALSQYNGIVSHLTLNSVGNAKKNTCEPALQSVPMASSPEANSLGSKYWQPTAKSCEGLNPYRLFLDTPDASIPATIEHWGDGRTTQTWGYQAYQAPALTTLAYSKTAGARSAAGTVSGTTTHAGPITIQIDTDGNGSYTDAVDASVEAYAPSPGRFSADWDGKDGAGKPAAVTGPIGLHAVQKQMSPIHLTRTDVEVSAGGISITQLAGPATGSPLVHWDDTALTTDAASRYSTTPVVKAPEAGTDSTAGVHGWVQDASNKNRTTGNNTGSLGSWGDFRSIDDWAYVPDSAEAVATVEPIANLRLDKSVQGEPEVAADGTTAIMTWKIDVENAATVDARETVVTDTYPAQVDPASVRVVTAPTQGSIDTATGVWTLGTLAGGAKAAVTFSGTVSLTAGGTTVTNTAQVSSPDSPAGDICLSNGDLASDTDQCDEVISLILPPPVAVTVPPSPTPTTVAVPEDNGPDSLAVTGSEVGIILPLVAIGMIVAGGGIFLWRRKSAQQDT